MSAIIKMMNVSSSPKTAFTKFIKDIQLWWPHQYTWSKEKLVSLKIAEDVGGHCTEVGPNNFSCDWGTITEFEENKRIKFLWQIDHHRVPQPNPECASEVEIDFEETDRNSCAIKLVHRHLERHHTDYHQPYFELLNGQHGWDYILGCFADYCAR